MAGTIDELNFKVILDDAEFDAKVKNDIKLSKDLNIALSSLVDIKKKVGKFTQDDVNNNRKANQILKDNARAQEAITREKLKTEGVQRRINAQIERATKGYVSQSRILKEMQGIALGYLSIHGASQLLTSLVQVTGAFEEQRTVLSAMLGDLNKAEDIISRIDLLSAYKAVDSGTLGNRSYVCGKYDMQKAEICLSGTDLCAHKLVHLRDLDAVREGIAGIASLFHYVRHNLQHRLNGAELSSVVSVTEALFIGGLRPCYRIFAYLRSILSRINGSLALGSLNFFFNHYTESFQNQ